MTEKKPVRCQYKTSQICTTPNKPCIYCDEKPSVKPDEDEPTSGKGDIQDLIKSIVADGEEAARKDETQVPTWQDATAPCVEDPETMLCKRVDYKYGCEGCEGIYATPAPDWRDTAGPQATAKIERMKVENKKLKAEVLRAERSLFDKQYTDIRLKNDKHRAEIRRLQAEKAELFRALGLCQTRAEFSLQVTNCHKAELGFTKIIEIAIRTKIAIAKAKEETKPLTIQEQTDETMRGR